MAKKKTKQDPAALPAPAARAALDQATKAIVKLKKEAARNFWAIGRRLAQVTELKLHRARGFATVDEYAEKALQLSRGTAFQYMRVAQAFSEEVAATFGPEKLDRALAYIARTPADEKPADIPELVIEIPGGDGGPAERKRFAEVTVPELRLATRSLRAPGGRRKGSRRDSDFPEEVAGLLAKANRALDVAVGRGAAGKADVTARLDEGRVLLDVRGVPRDRAGGALRAVAAALAQRQTRKKFG